MPDLDILIEISDYYEIDLRELLDGERKSEKMNKENKEFEETVLKAVEYTNNETECNTKRIHWLLLVGVVFLFLAQLIQHTELVGFRIMSIFSDFAEGAAYGMIICGLIETSRYGKRLRNFKKRLLKRQ